jgi:hypothetical protein
MKNSMAQRWVGRGAHGGDLLHRELARQHDLRQTGVLQETRLLGRADVGLGAGVQLDGGQVELQQAHVLDDERVGTGVVHLPGHLARAFQLVVAQDGVERDENAAVEAVGVRDQAFQVADVVARTGARAEGRAADIDGIGAMVDGLDADVGIARGREQFNLVGQQ